jgi:hypothetical protein
MSRELQQVLGPSVRIDHKSHIADGRGLTRDLVESRSMSVLRVRGNLRRIGQAGVNWFPPQGIEPQLGDAPALVAWGFHRPLLGRLAQRWLWTHGGWIVPAAPGYTTDDGDIVQPGLLFGSEPTTVSG